MTARSRATLLVILVSTFSFASRHVALAETILLPRTVPSFSQNFTDGPGAWGDCALGTAGCPDQICTTGCLVTAFSSVLAYYEIEVTVSSNVSCTGRSRSGMDPGILNDWLRENGGFGRCVQDPIGDCCLAWDKLPGDVELTFYSNRSDDGLNPVSSVVIDHALRGGEPVVAGVHWGAFCRSGSQQTEDCHWVILTGKIGDTYTIVDPMNLDPTDPRGVRTTLDAGTRGSYIIDRFVVASAASSLPQIVAPETDKPDSSDDESGVSIVSTAAVLLGLLAAITAVIVLISRSE